ncbi:MAG: hypothetical protein ACREBG_02285 [Pyrinomonadaceae bacterium]
MLKINRYRLVRNLSGAFAASIVASTLFALFGYSGGATIRDFANEFAISLISFGSAATFVSYAASRDRLIVEVALVSLLGALIEFMLKITILEGANGLPAYFEQFTQLHSWKPMADLISRCFTSTIILTLITLPFVALGGWISRFVGRLFDRTS